MVPAPLFVFAPDRSVLGLLAVLVSGASVLASAGYFSSPEDRRFYSSWTAVFLLTVLGCLFSASWLGYLVFLELSTAALFFLTARKEPRTAFRYLTAQLAGAALLLGGIAGAGGGLAFGPVEGDVRLLFILGLGVKTALPGLHFWLPETHGRAPAPVSALLSGVAVKTGAFGILTALGGVPSPGLVAAGAVMALWGALQATLQSDVKRLLAYSTVSQLGYVMASAGAGGAAGAVYHSLAHGLFKGCLFLCAGSLEKSFGTRDLGLLEGRGRELRWTRWLFWLSAAAIMGLPGTVGYGSKIFVKEPLGSWPLAGIALAVANGGTVMSFCKMGYYAFGPGKRSAGGRSVSESGWMVLGMVLLSVPVVVLGLFPGVLGRLLGGGEQELFSAGKLAESLGVFCAGAALFFLFRKRLGTLGELPDADRLTDRLPAFFARAVLPFRRLQGGNLREYVLAATVSTIFLLLLLS